jgi:hypothetical protein
MRITNGESNLFCQGESSIRKMIWLRLPFIVVLLCTLTFFPNQLLANVNCCKMTSRCLDDTQTWGEGSCCFDGYCLWSITGWCQRYSYTSETECPSLYAPCYSGVIRAWYQNSQGNTICLKAQEWIRDSCDPGSVCCCLHEWICYLQHTCHAAEDPCPCT